MLRIRPLLFVPLFVLALSLGACRGPGEPSDDVDQAPVLSPPMGEASSRSSVAGDPWGSALAAYEAGDYGAALQAIGEAPGLDSDTRLRVSHASLLLFARRFDEAKSIVDTIADDPRARAGVRVVRAHLRINTQDYESARELAGEVASGPVASGVGAPPGYGVFIHELACLAMAWSEANQNEHVRAIRWFDRILDRQADDLLGLLGRGNSLIALNLLQEAQETLRRGLAVHPTNPYALAELGMVHLKLGDEEAAETHFQKALEKDDARYTCPHEGLGLLYLRQGRKDQARDHLERAIRINPDIEYKKYNGLARIYLEEGNVAEAERLLEKSIANFPHDAEARALLKELRGSSP